MSIESLKRKLVKYGNIEICKEGFVLTVLITGTGLTKVGRVMELQQIINEYAGERFSAIEAMRNDETYFCMVLKPRTPTPSVEVLVDVLERITRMEEYVGRERCYYLDTDFDSLSAARGYNDCLENIRAIATQALSKINK